MALSAELEALLKHIQDDEKREATRKQLLENQENGLRQADYSKKQNELKEERDKLQAEWKKHVDWYNDAKEEYDTTKTELETVQEKLSKLEAIKHNSSQKENVDESELDKQIRVLREQTEAAVARAEKAETSIQSIDQMIKEGKLMTSDKYEQSLNKKADTLANAIMDVWEKQTAYKSEFGKELSRQALLDEAQKFQGDLDRAYESLTKKDRQTKYETEVEAKYKKEYEDKIRKAGLPIDAGEGPVPGAGLGALQRRVLGVDEKGDIPSNIPADGSGRVAYLAAQELIKEGKA